MIQWIQRLTIDEKTSMIFYHHDYYDYYDHIYDFIYDHHFLPLNTQNAPISLKYFEKIFGFRIHQSLQSREIWFGKIRAYSLVDSENFLLSSIFLNSSPFLVGPFVNVVIKISSSRRYFVKTKIKN